jgi:HSP20 family protein
MTTKNRELIAVEPRAFMNRMLRDFDRWFDVPFFGFARTPAGFTWLPDLEVFERDHQLLVRVDLPGLKKEEITVTVAREGLTIEGERRLETEKAENEWYRTERTYGRFFRVVPLPEGFKADEVTATFANGVLEVKVPLPGEVAGLPRRKVEIGTGEKKEVKAAA